MADELFGRDIVLNVGGLRIASRLISGAEAPLLKIGFKVTKTLRKSPNSTELSIHNLSPKNRTRIQQKNQPTTIEAGYIDNTSVLFSGDLEFGESQLVDQDWISKVQAGDGSKAFRKSRISTSLKGPVTLKSAVNTAAKQLGVNLGNLKEKLDQGGIRKTLTEFTNGIALSGKAEKEFDKLIRSMGYGWSIQDGQLLVLGKDEFLGGGTTVLSRDNGLIGTPEPGEDGFLRLRGLIQPSLTPGRRIEIKSKINGFYRLEKTEAFGDTWGTPWYIDMEAKPIG